MSLPQSWTLMIFLSVTLPVSYTHRITSALISAARSTAAVSVEKNGEPMPQPKSTTRPFSKCRIDVYKRQTFGVQLDNLRRVECLRTRIQTDDDDEARQEVHERARDEDDELLPPCLLYTSRCV